MRVVVKARKTGLVLPALEGFLWIAAAMLLGIYGLVYLERTVYQSYEEWAFDRQVLHKSQPLSLPQAAPKASRPVLPVGSLLGRLEIPAAGVRAIVVEGTDRQELRRAVGHVEGTALPGQPGNIGLAGHRDTFFRGLRHIRKGDRIQIRTLEGKYDYAVDSILIAGPDDVQVLGSSARPELTLVTCYPFNYVGSAPRRFIVRAREISSPGFTAQASPGS